jgi:hypothetical protein
MLDFMSGLPKGKFPQRDQGLFPEEVLKCAFRLPALIHNSSLESIEQGSRGKIHHHDFIRMLYDPIRNRFAHADTADLPDLIVETFQVLNVHCG